MITLENHPRLRILNILAIGSQNAVLLRTARVKFSNPNSESDGIVVTLIFDDGSQRSYLGQTAEEKLNLETCGRAAMLINVFGLIWQTAQQLETLDQVQFTVECLKDDFKITIDSYVVPEICGYEIYWLEHSISGHW